MQWAATLCPPPRTAIGQIGLRCVRHRRHDVVDVGRPYDQLRPAVDHPIERRARDVERRVLRLDHVAALAQPQIREQTLRHKAP
jgi:hypothetical protein